MSDSRWGATPDEWASLSLVAGLTPDLLPVVSNPGARVSPNSNLKTLGKVPSLYNPSGEVVGIAKWTEKTATEKDIDRWAAQPDYGICLQTRVVRALDIDIDDEAIVSSIVELIAGLCNFKAPLAIRTRADSSKILVAFRLDGDFTKRILKTDSGNIEFLANGQQFIAAGTHPKGAKYTWRDGFPADFPELTRDEFEAIWAVLMERYAIEEVVEYGAGRVLREQRREVALVDDTADWLKAKGWVKSKTRDGRLNIRCPFEGEHSGASADDTATQYMPRGVGGFEVGHFRCLHAHCAKRSDGDFLEKLGVDIDDFDVVLEEQRVTLVPAVVDGKKVDVLLPAFAKDLKGNLLTTLPNVVLALRSHDWFGCEVARDAFRDCIMLTPTGTRQWREFTDADYTRLRLQLATKGLRGVSAEMLRDAIALIADENVFDSARLWLEQEVPAWDGVERIERWYIDTFGCEDSPYVRAVGLYTWTALAGRVLEPGCKCDMVPILSGSQGIGKTECVAAIAPAREMFTELDLAAHDDNLSRLMRGRLVGEFGELRGLQTKELEAIKSFITRRWENWVPKYKEFAITFPRRILFFGTTNKTQVLADDTGNRRWLPLQCHRADVARVVRDRAQLWAEARERWTAEGVVWEGAQTLAVDQHNAYRVVDTWEEPIAAWVGVQFADARGQQVFTTPQVLHGALGIEARNMRRADEMRISGVMKSLGFTHSRTMHGGKREWRWVRG